MEEGHFSKTLHYTCQGKFGSVNCKQIKPIKLHPARVTMSNLAVSKDIYEVTKLHKKVYYINFSNVLFNHYHNNSFKINNNNSNNNLF